MFSTSQHQKRMRNSPMKHPNGCNNIVEQDFGRDHNIPLQSYSAGFHPNRFVQNVRGFNGLDYYPTPPFYDDQEGAAELNNFNYRTYLPSIPNYQTDLSSFDVARMQLQHLFMQSHFGTTLEGFMTPPNTVSSSMSTMFPQSTSSPDSVYSPSPSDDFESLGPYGSVSNFDFNVSKRCGSARSCCKPEDRGYERGAMYTAEDVHVVVKNNRDGNKQRVVSNKVFVGGISHSMNREVINTFFGKFGTVFVDWPVKQRNNNGLTSSIPSNNNHLPLASYSYLFLVYSEEQSVIKLMKECKQSGNDFFVSVPGCRENIQIRPWFIKNAFYISPKARNTRCIDIHRTVFVGGLPRIVTAEDISKMFSEFGTVLLVTIDIDQDYGYPKGAARVTFKRDSSFNRALERKYLKFKNIDSSKTLIEIKPYVMEDVGCDQCGGLWFNPFLDIYDQLQSCKKKQKPTNNKSLTMWRTSEQIPDSKGQPLDSEDLFSKIDAGYQNNLNTSDQAETLDETNSENEIETGARKFLETTKAFGLDKQQTVTVLGTEYNLGPDLWYKFLPPPSFEVGNEPVHMDPDQKIKSFLCMKRTNVYSNKSSYCKERPCRQYYCPSCSNKLHSGPDQHVLLPAGKPERRPRKDKNMYLVSLNH